MRNSNRYTCLKNENVILLELIFISNRPLLENDVSNTKNKVVHEQYPYLHIITWGLPRRYFGLLKIFNLQIEYQPHLFLKQYSDAFTDFEPPSTSPVSPIQSSLIEPAPSTSKYNYVNKDENEEKEEPEVDQNKNAVNERSTRKSKRSRKKPIISIKINLDEDLKNLKTRSYSKNLDRILSKRSPKTHLLVIERSTSSKRDEYHLRIVNNNIINSHPYSKLLKKNREKRRFSSSFPISVNTAKSTDIERISSSNFTSENIYPLLNKPSIPESSYLKGPYSNDNLYQKNYKSNYVTDHISDKIKNTNFQNVPNIGPIQNNPRKESLDCKNTSNNYALALPSHLIPYEEQITEEKPLRNWPIITQLFTNSNFEICKNYLKSFTANEREDTEVPEANGNVQEENIKIDISPGIQYHNATKITTLIDTKTSKQLESTEDENEDAQEELESESRTSNVDSNHNYLINKLSSSKPKFPPKPTNYSVGQINTVHSFPNSEDNIPSRVFTSTACLQIESPGEDTPKNLIVSNNIYNESWKMKHSRYSLSDPLLNMRLLSSSTKTYESIVIPSSQEDDEFCNSIKMDEFVERNANKENFVELTKHKPKPTRKFYIIGITIAILISFVLGIILFITVSDSTTVKNVMSRDFK